MTAPMMTANMSLALPPMNWSAKGRKADGECTAVEFRISGLELTEEAGEGGAGGLAVVFARDSGHRRETATFPQRGILRVERCPWGPELLIVGKLHTLGHDANDRGSGVIDAQRFAENIGIGGKAVAPQAVTYQHHRFGAGAILFRQEIAPQVGWIPKNAKQIGSGEDAVGLFRESLVAADVSPSLRYKRQWRTARNARRAIRQVRRATRCRTRLPGRASRQ